ANCAFPATCVRTARGTIRGWAAPPATYTPPLSPASSSPSPTVISPSCRKGRSSNTRRRLNDECRNPNDEGSTNYEARIASGVHDLFRHSGFVILSSFVIRHWSLAIHAHLSSRIRDVRRGRRGCRVGTGNHPSAQSPAVPGDLVGGDGLPARGRETE